MLEVTNTNHLPADIRCVSCSAGRWAASADKHLALVACEEVVRGLVVTDDMHQSQVSCGEEEAVEVEPVDLTSAGLLRRLHQTRQDRPGPLNPAPDGHGPGRRGQLRSLVRTHRCEDGSQRAQNRHQIRPN